MTILLTGVAGFIGMHIANRLISNEHTVIGIDNLNDYYDVSLKESRLNKLSVKDSFSFYKLDIANATELKKVFELHDFDIVIHLAAQAGVRYSLENPQTYVDTNLVGFANILESCRHYNVKHLIYASSSSVYGANVKMPFSTSDNVDHPVSLYAATKKANELMAHTYSHLYDLPTTGLRFFTVYGPWGRPDMAYFKFTKNIIEGKPIQVFNHGKMKRDFTYIDDIVEGVVYLLDRPPQPNPDWNRENPEPGTSYAPYKIYNIGNNQPIDLLTFINHLEDIIGMKAIIEYLPMQPGDVEATYADIDDLQRDIGFSPSTPLEEGLKQFVEWYKEYYK